MRDDTGLERNTTPAAISCGVPIRPVGFKPMAKENSSGLLRQYFPKGTDLGVYSQEDLDYVAWEMNDRPRKRLDYLKPNEMIEPLLLR